MAINIAAFRSLAEFKAMMDEMIRTLHETPTSADGKRVQVAGDPEFDTAVIRRERGIPVHPPQYDAIIAAAQRLGVERHI